MKPEPLWLFFCIESYFFGVAPEDFEVVIFAILVVEDMYNNLDIIHKYPSALFVAGLAESLKAGLFCIVGNLIGDGASLARACAGCDDKIVRYGAFATKVENFYIFTMPLGGYLGSGYSELSVGRFFLFCQNLS